MKKYGGPSLQSMFNTRRQIRGQATQTTVEHAILVYQQTKKPFNHRVVYALSEDPRPKKGEMHVASLEPAAWIEALLNTKDKLKVIEDLYI